MHTFFSKLSKILSFVSNTARPTRDTNGDSNKTNEGANDLNADSTVSRGVISVRGNLSAI